MLWLILYYMVGAVGLFLFLHATAARRAAPAALAGLLFALTPNHCRRGAWTREPARELGVDPGRAARASPLAGARPSRLAQRSSLPLVLGAQILRGHGGSSGPWLAPSSTSCSTCWTCGGGGACFTSPSGGRSAASLGTRRRGLSRRRARAPVLAYSPHSIRGGGPAGGVGFEYATGWSLGWREILTFVVPSAMGFGGETYWGTMPFTDYPHYLGILTLLFAAVALLPAGRAAAPRSALRRRRRSAHRRRRRRYSSGSIRDTSSRSPSSGSRLRSASILPSITCSTTSSPDSTSSGCRS